MLTNGNVLDETSVVVENIFVLGLVKKGFQLPQALLNGFCTQGGLILKALEREEECCLSGEQDILEFLNDSEQNGYLIEVSTPPAKDFCFDDNGALLGYSHALSLKLTDYFYDETLDGCISKAAEWHNAYIREQISTFS